MYLKVRSLIGSVTRLGDLLEFGELSKAVAAISLAKSPTFLGNLGKGVQFFNFPSQIIFRQLL